MPTESFNAYVERLESDPERLVALSLARRRAALGRRVRMLRTAAGVTQGELAASASVTQADVSRIESGKANPTIDTLTRIGDCLEATLELQAPTELANSTGDRIE